MKKVCYPAIISENEYLKRTIIPEQRDGIKRVLDRTRIMNKK